MYVGPVRRRLGADDAFFEAGNVQRALFCKLSVFRQEEEEDSTAMMSAFEDDQPRYECMFQDCGAKFSSLKRHEAHYETSHRNLCSTCGCSFPTHRLLDLHLSELHDSFFKAMAERRAMYVCLVEGCPDVFESSKKRHVHLVEVHRYPKSFDFNRPPLGKKKSRVRRMEGVRIDGTATKLGLDNATVQRKPRRGRGRPKAANHKATPLEANGVATSSGVEETESMSDGDPQVGVGPRSATSATVDYEGQQSLALAPGLGSTISAARRGNPGRPAHDGDMELEMEVGSCTEGAMVEVGAIGFSREGGNKSPPKIRRTCKFWRTATGCRAGGECRFRHDSEDAAGGGLPGSGVERVKGWGVGTSGSSASGGSWAGEGHVAGVGGVSGVDELVAGMQKLLIPNHLSFGSSARRGKPIGSVRR